MSNQLKYANSASGRQTITATETTLEELLLASGETGIIQTCESWLISIVSGDINIYTNGNTASATEGTPMAAGGHYPVHFAKAKNISMIRTGSVDAVISVQPKIILPTTTEGVPTGAGATSRGEYGAGNVTEDTQRVTIATDDVNLSAIKTATAATRVAVETIDDTVYTDGAGTPSKGLLVMGTDGTHPQALSVNSDGELKVNLEASDIEIGAVEIKDGTTDTRLTVGLDATKNAIFVQSESLAQESGGNLDIISGDTTNIDTTTTANNALLTNIDTTTTANKALLTNIDTTTTANKALLTNIDTTTTANNALLTTIDSDTSDIKTAVEVLDDIVKTEDSAHVSGDAGVQVLAVRADADGALVSANGDYAPLQVDAEGKLKVTKAEDAKKTNVANVVTSSNVGVTDNTWVNQGALIDVTSASKIGVFVELTANNSSDIRIRSLVKSSAGGVLCDQLDPSMFIEPLGDADRTTQLRTFDCSDITHIQLQTKAFIVGTTAGTITINYILTPLT